MLDVLRTESNFSRMHTRSDVCVCVCARARWSIRVHIHADQTDKGTEYMNCYVSVDAVEKQYSFLHE